MNTYNVMLGIDHAARDTRRRLHVRVKAEDALSAAIAAEAIGDARVFDPGVEYTHAMRVVGVKPRRAAAAQPMTMPVPMPLPAAA